MADDPIRLEVQRLLVVTLEGDTRIVDPGRLMRLPGWSSPQRQQPVIHLDTDATYDAADIRDRLVAYAESMGIHDVDAAYRALQVAEQLEVQAGRETDSEAAQELRDHAAVLRATRGSPDPSDMALASAMLGRGHGPVVHLGSVPTPNAPVSGDRQALTTVQADAYRGAAHLSRVPAPCCGAGESPAGRMLSHVGQRVMVRCHRHEIRWEEAATVARVVVAAVDTLLDEDIDDADPIYVDPEDLSPLIEADAVVEARLIASSGAAEMAIQALRMDELAQDILNDSTLVSNEVDRPSIIRTTARGVPEESDHTRTVNLSVNQGSTVQEASEAAEDLEAAVVHFEGLGGGPVWCPRGPNLHTAKGDSVGSSTRLACCNYRCGTCGPHLILALRAAARVTVRRATNALAVTESWSGARFVASDSVIQAARKWVAKAPDDRMYISIGQAPGCEACLIMWRGTMHEPKVVAGGGSLRRHVDAHGVRVAHADLPDTAEAMVQGIDIDAWATVEAKRVVLLGGGKRLRSEVATLRDQILGRSRLKKAAPLADDEVRIRTYTSESDVRKEAEYIAMSKTEDIGEEVDVRRRNLVRTWRFAGGMTPVAPILKRLVTDGVIKPVRGRTRKVEDGESGWVDLLLD